jgi:hypothetical protein
MSRQTAFLSGAVALDLPDPPHPAAVHRVQCDACGSIVAVRMESDLPITWGALLESQRIAHYCSGCLDALLKG